ncbi:MAG: zf-TFIIB domain-containing protein [Ferruginibacter sp.]|nr:zf-TFIIB domain-containing protein [Ferruginibacter sp.]
MKCPNCEETLIMSERQGIEIDYCPKCRGVWLDRGELDKIIEKSVSANPPAQGGSYDKPKYDDRYDNKDWYDNNKHYKKRKGNFLSDLFD